MPIQTSHSNARSNFLELLDEIIHEITISELQGLAETVHLLRSPKNAKRLLKALARTRLRFRSAKSRIKIRK